MWTWIKRVLIATFIAWGGYTVYDFYRAGYHTRPEMPAGAFSISYKNGLRAILVDVPNEQKTRRYFGTPIKVPFYLEDAWSFCSSPLDEEMAQVNTILHSRNWPGERIEAVCKIEIDSEVVVRGIVTSVPKL